MIEKKGTAIRKIPKQVAVEVVHYLPFTLPRERTELNPTVLPTRRARVTRILVLMIILTKLWKTSLQVLNQWL